MNKSDNLNIDCFKKSIDYIYPVLLYLCGLIIGTVLYNKVSAQNTEGIISGFLNSNTKSFITLLTNRVCIYSFVYIITVLLGMCLIGYPFLMLLPVIIGFIISYKLSYLYSSYDVKEIGYSLLMIIPEAASAVTVLIYSVVKSSILSRFIFTSTVKKDMTENERFKSYLISYGIYFIIINLIAVINASLTYCLGGLISF